MKKTLPLVIGMVVGMIALAEFYIEWYVFDAVTEELLSFAQILLASAYVLGAVNLVQVNWPKIRRREEDWGYKVVLLGSAVVMGLAGAPWHELGESSTRVEIVQGTSAGARPVIRVHTRDDAQVKIGSETHTGSSRVEVGVEPGEHTVVVSMALYGYDEIRRDVTLAPGQVAEIHADVTMLWGKDGRAYKWMYNHIFDPCNSTMFALLAFFIASAAFRAFRARNVEAALLLGSAIVILIGRAPIGSAISDFLPAVSDWLVDVGNNAGRRAIMMGAALGAIATGLRVILGLERSHLGSE